MSDAEVAAYWDAQAATFDEQPDHGLGPEETRAAWTDLLERLVPPSLRRVADLGCGTGSLSVLLAGQGHEVTGVDAAPAMVERARGKAAATGVRIDVRVGDVAAPDLPAHAYDVVLARHVVWALPDPRTSLRAWTGLLAGGGRLVLVEGMWWTGDGIAADDLVAALSEDARLAGCAVERLVDPALWGGPIDDERYVVVADLSPDVGVGMPA
jgi:SAM-dependent methyltransferase